KAASQLPYYPKIWKPNLLVSVYDPDHFSVIIPLIQAIVYPFGRMTVFKVLADSAEKIRRQELRERLTQDISPFREKGIFVKTSVVEAPEVFSGTITIMQTVNSMFFAPNTLFYMLEKKREAAEDRGIIEEASREGLGIIVLKYNEQTGFGQQNIVNLWIRRQSPNINLAILVALQLEKNWRGQVRLIQVVEREEDRAEASAYLERLKSIMRMSPDCDVEILMGTFKNAIKRAPRADINIFGMGDAPDTAMIHEVAERIQTSVLFLRDSKHESALA
ncbi:MAG TPA: hypothetical protein PKV41_06065, partial [Candidatus Omnitrophota bacterium]|nr:hypothetical protein [Candidatus Omnitrophota bacterium]